MFFLLASDDLGGLKPIPENLDEIESVLTDLDDDPNMGSFGSGPYWPKIRDRLLGSSSAKNPEEAIREWKFVRSWISSGQCELCDHRPIKYHFQIENRLNSNRLVLGSECIYNYLEIPGVPSREILKKRLNQIRSMAKAVAEGRAGEGAVQELEQVQDLERTVNLLIGQVSRPDKDIDIQDYLTTLLNPHHALSLIGSNSATFKAFDEVVIQARFLKRTLENLQRRSKLYKGFTLLPAVQAIMRFRDLGERRSTLTTLHQAIQDTFKLGKAEEAIEMARTELQTWKREKAARYQAQVEVAKSDFQTKYSDELSQLKPYPHLAFMLQAGISAALKTIDTYVAKTVAELDKLTEGSVADRRYLSAWQLQNHSIRMVHFGDSSVERSAAHILDLMDSLDAVSKEMAHFIQRRYGLGAIRDITGIRKAILRLADDGDLPLEKDFTRIGNLVVALEVKEAFWKLVEQEVDEVVANNRASQGRKVFEVFGEDLNFDVKKFYESVPLVAEHSYHGFLQQFGRDIFAKWASGRLSGLSYKQRDIIMKRDKKANGRTLWDDMQDVFGKTYRASKFAASYDYSR